MPLPSPESLIGYFPDSSRGVGGHVAGLDEPEPGKLGAVAPTHFARVESVSVRCAELVAQGDANLVNDLRSRGTAAKRLERLQHGHLVIAVLQTSAPSRLWVSSLESSEGGPSWPSCRRGTVGCRERPLTPDWWSLRALQLDWDAGEGAGAGEGVDALFVGDVVEAGAGVG